MTHLKTAVNEAKTEDSVKRVRLFLECKRIQHIKMRIENGKQM